MWDTKHPDLVSTPNVNINGTVHCIFCGNEMKSIQAGLRGFVRNSVDPYAVTGKSCICKKAMDWLEFQEKKKKLRAEHDEKVQALEQEYDHFFVNEKAITRLAKKAMESKYFRDGVLQYSYGESEE